MSGSVDPDSGSDDGVSREGEWPHVCMILGKIKIKDEFQGESRSVLIVLFFLSISQIK